MDDAKLQSPLLHQEGSLHTRLMSSKVLRCVCNIDSGLDLTCLPQNLLEICPCHQKLRSHVWQSLRSAQAKTSCESSLAQLGIPLGIWAFGTLARTNPLKTGVFLDINMSFLDIDSILSLFICWKDVRRQVIPRLLMCE